MTEKKHFASKKADDMLGGKDQWKNVDSTEATCPKCEHNKAYYMQIQIRSADEPSSLFYKVKNKHFNFYSAANVVMIGGKVKKILIYTKTFFFYIIKHFTNLIHN